VGSLFCARCQAAISTPPPQREPGSPLAEWRASAQFGGPIQKAIHAYKYKNQRRMAVPLTDRLIAVLEQSGWQPTLITAAPLHESRLRERGYNQAALLAERLAQASDLPFRGEIIRRVRATRPQVGLNARDRQENVADAFAAQRTAAGESILIVDDVYTTGATLRACAHALREAGAACVWGLAVASAHIDLHNQGAVTTPGST
jgi:ComF family protein